MWEYNYTENLYPTELYHHGVLGMKWGVRRYQNSDGSLTPKGEKKYLNSKGDVKKRYQKKSIWNV